LSKVLANIFFGNSAQIYRPIVDEGKKYSSPGFSREKKILSVFIFYGQIDKTLKEMLQNILVPKY